MIVDLLILFFHLFCKQNKYTSNFSSNTMYMSTSFGTKTIEMLYGFHFSYISSHTDLKRSLFFNRSRSNTHTHTHHTHASHTLTHAPHTHTHLLPMFIPTSHRITISFSSYILFITICF